MFPTIVIDIGLVLIVIILTIITDIAASFFLKQKSHHVVNIAWRLIVCVGIVLAGIYTGLEFISWVALILLIANLFMLAHEFSTKHKLSVPATMLLIAIVFAPLSEELLFRAWLIDTISGSDYVKVITSSIIFSIWHVKNVLKLKFAALTFQIIYTFFFGLLVSSIWLWTDTLLWPIAIHAINNTLALTITRKLAPNLVREK